MSKRAKRGPKPFPWNPANGEVKNEGHKMPAEVHAALRQDEVKALIDRLASDPDFKERILVQVGLSN